MGMPVKIKDLAFNMVRLSGLRPYLETDPTANIGDIAIRIIGLRPGEKMHEELSYANNLIGTIHPRIMTANEIALSTNDLQKIINNLNLIIRTQDYNALIKYLTKTADYKQDKNIRIETAWEQTEENQENNNNIVISLNSSKGKK